MELCSYSSYNYNRLKTAPEEDGTFIYNKQTNGSAYKLNGADNVVLPINEDLKVADDIVETNFTFKSYQTTLQFIGIFGRPCILSIELWLDTSLLEVDL